MSKTYQLGKIQSTSMNFEIVSYSCSNNLNKEFFIQLQENKR